ncbi:MAG: alpha/beta fold hydrolase [Lachnospiraceae bacterium]|nr:alpha/beta fold hydrolase [Lachnospiraceae bacterium]
MEIRVTRYNHISETDGLPLAVVRTEPADGTDVCGSAVLVHGMCEHKGRYEPFVNYLAEQGYIVTIFDLRGHGESVREPEDLGYFYEGGYEALLADIHEMVLEAKTYAAERTGREDLPFVMIAHSMGTLAARCYIRMHDDELDKLVLLGCPSKPAGMWPGLQLVRGLVATKGGRARSKVVDTIVGGGFEKRFAEEHTPFAWTNSDPAEVNSYREDPLCGYTFTLNGYENLIRMTMLCYTDGGCAMNNPELPIRFYSGADDPCAISKEKLGEAIKLLRKQGYKNTKGKTYPGMRHEILREREKEKVWADILAFLKS